MIKENGLKWFEAQLAMLVSDNCTSERNVLWRVGNDFDVFFFFYGSFSQFDLASSLASYEVV